MMALEIRQLVSEVRNPDYDRRVRYGMRGVESLPIGARIVVRRDQEMAGDVPYEIMSFRISVAGQGVDFFRRDFVRHVIALSETVEPTSFREFLMLHDENDFTAQRIMEHLFQHPQGRFLIEEAMKVVQNEDHETV